MRIISVITALALSQTDIVNAQEAENNLLAKDPLYQEALGALTDHLPLIASQKFTSLIKQKSDSLTQEQHLKLIFLLAEAQIRANKPQEAIQSLSNKLIAENPDAIFWRGQALAATGRYSEAIEVFQKAAPKSKNYQLGQLKSANLAIAIGDTDKALSILNASIKNSKKASVQTYLSLANLYLSKKDSKNATNTLTKVKPENPSHSRAKQIMLAQVDLLEKKYDSAIPALEKILAEDNLQLNTQNFAALQLADAFHDNGQGQEAISTLIEYIDKQPGQLISPMFAKLGQWIKSDTSITDPTILKLMEWANLDTEDSADPVTPLNELQTDLSAFAHYYYARFLANKPEPANKSRAIQEFANLRLRFPTHILSGSSLSNSASTLLSIGKVDDAKETLQRIHNLTTPIDPVAKQQAGILLGKLLVDDKNYAEAAQTYQSIVESTTGNIKEAAIMNAAMSYLAASDDKGFNDLLQNTQSPTVQQNLKLEHALWSARHKQPNARSILHSFTLKHPEHPRINEAYLSLALNCLNAAPIDLELSNLITPKITQNNLNEDLKVDLLFLKYRNAVTKKNYTTAANIAKRFLEHFPDHQCVPEFTLYQGQALYHNGQHNAARQLLTGMTTTYPEHPLTDFAEYYSAMSAKQEGTPQSAKEAIKLLSKISKSKSNLAEEALLQLARLYISTNQPKLAVDSLVPVYIKQQKNKKDLNLSLELASAYQALGDAEKKHYQQALDIYKDLSAQFENNEQIVNEIKYNEALLLQHIDQDNAALEIYYSVINIDIKKKPITEWKYYYLCGFRAITMLEEMGNPKAAIAIAKKLASSKGQRAQEASTKARDLEMKHMIWQH